MKRILFICVFFSGLAAVAQGPQVVLPWMPARDTNHIKTIRYYKYDTVTLERTLHYTENYDRHGYQMHPLTKLTYNDQGLLTRRLTLREGFSAANPMGWIDTADIWDIYYSSDGVVLRVKNEWYGYYHNPGHDTNIADYELIAHKTHPVYGLLDYTFRGSYISNGEIFESDTFYYRHEYDDKGHLLRQYTNYGDDREDVTFHYRPDGRVEYRVGYYYERWDSLYYHYDDQGVLTHMTGKEYDLGMEADVYIRCQPDGRRREERLVWHVYMDDDEFDDGTVEVHDYDSHGLLLRSRIIGSKVPYFDREIDYWE